MVYLLLDILVRALILCPLILLWNIAIIWQMNAMEQKFTADMCHPAWEGHFVSWNSTPEMTKNLNIYVQYYKIVRHIKSAPYKL